MLQPSLSPKDSGVDTPYRCIVFQGETLPKLIDLENE